MDTDTVPGHFIGKSIHRVDGIEKVNGQAHYSADLPLGRVHYACIVRAPKAHARINRIDVSKALGRPGIRAVVTGESCPKRIGHAIRDQYPLARGKVRFWGDPVAVVVGSSEEACRQAADLVGLDLEPLPPLLHPKEAATAGAPLIHEELGEYWHLPELNPQAGSNIAHHYHLERGDVGSAFSSAHLVLECEYWVPWIAHAQIEPHSATALWDGRHFTLWSSSQSPFFIRETISRMYDLSPADVQVIIPYVGGGFGGKSDVTIEPLLAVVAHEVPNTPVRLVLTREEMFFGTAVGRGAWGQMKTAVDAQGMLLAHEVQLYFGSGGYADYSIWIAQGGGHNSTGPYAIPNLSLDSCSVYTNTPPTGAYRGYGHPEVHWMMERQMDQIARRLKMDPVELRLKNLLLPGKVNALGQVMKPYNGRADACLQAVADELQRSKPPSHARRARGTGLACFMKSPVMRTNAQSGAILRFNEDGSVMLYTGAVELGQGVFTVLSQIAAEALSIPVGHVHYVTTIDTNTSPHEWQTVASHTTWAVGNAIRLAASDAMGQIKTAAAEIFGVNADSLVAANGCIYPAGQEQLAIPYARIAIGYRRADGSAVNPPVIGRGTFVPKGLTFPEPATGQGNLAASWTFGCQGAEVEVDLDTGQVHVLRLVSAQDAGRILNHDTASGQVEGAMTMGLGAALMEELKFDQDGRIRNWSFTDYRIPTSVDIPEMKVIFIETEDATGPYGARGLGEHGIVAVPPAIANAVANALNIEITQLPISAETLLTSMEEGEVKPQS